MNETLEKLLLVAAGAAAGAVGYMALKHPDELKRFAADSVDLGRELLERKMNETAEDAPRSESTEEATTWR